MCFSSPAEYTARISCYLPRPDSRLPEMVDVAGQLAARIAELEDEIERRQARRKNETMLTILESS